MEIKTLIWCIPYLLHAALKKHSMVFDRGELGVYMHFFVQCECCINAHHKNYSKRIVNEYEVWLKSLSWTTIEKIFSLTSENLLNLGWTIVTTSQFHIIISKYIFQSHATNDHWTFFSESKHTSEKYNRIWCISDLKDIIVKILTEMIL